MKFIGMMFACALAAVAFTALLLTPVMFMDRQTCFDRGELMQRDVDWRITTGCSVRFGDRYVPMAAVRFADGQEFVELSDEDAE